MIQFDLYSLTLLVDGSYCGGVSNLLLDMYYYHAVHKSILLEEGLVCLQDVDHVIVRSTSQNTTSKRNRSTVSFTGLVNYWLPHDPMIKKCPRKPTRVSPRREVKVESVWLYRLLAARLSMEEDSGGGDH